MELMILVTDTFNNIILNVVESNAYCKANSWGFSRVFNWRLIRAFSNSLIIHECNSQQMRHIWVTCMSLDTQWTLRRKSFAVLMWDQTWFWSQIKHLHFNEHFSIINTSLTTIPKMTWLLFDVINLDSVGCHKLFHKRNSVDISPPTSWPPSLQTF